MGRLVTIRSRRSIRSLGARDLHLDLAGSDIYTIASAVSGLSDRRKRKLLRALTSRIEPERLTLQGDRIAAAKMLIAMLPLSAPDIERYLHRRENRWCYELHFSVFCFLDHVHSNQSLSELKDSVLRMVCDYLLAVPVNTAKAAWMAGDLLGDHWPGRESLDALKRIAIEARYAAGRNAAGNCLLRAALRH